ncbi:hypothetical protein SDC9_195339 [bioreactor metagenome]|uniref:Uncharacterized protein n=1 Tax=bioreactor metagenome TaxID=1076179 RepID=A0A645I8R2_9ZZZZ
MIGDAEKEVRKFLKRAKRAFLKTAGRDLRYIMITSDKKADSDEEVRVHHHIIMDRMDYEVIRKLWTYGDTDYRVLKNQKDYTRLAFYLVKNARQQPDKKKWSSSRNLKKPVEMIRRVRRKGEIKVPKGCHLVERHTYELDRTGKSEYVRYIDEREDGADQITEEGGRGPWQ